ncbi:RagB/SusD family nutrient uptake outer membrane protein [Halosquirtibacter laminarini]|uniref:RagB/SusD family nutrient uptake outer membrane protein n=1 Tax=Halosquirtibacter laminarini TaxID=3374600 RepID=A0AC61NNU2_9BACT|nr:RagB/SusD family nutrient uptake outer membrane protein [Prolixibacteraceae bacterium]
MKQLLYIFLALLLTGITACESVLDKDPIDSISSSDYWTSARDLELYVNQFYPTLPGISGYNEGTASWDLNSDSYIPGRGYNSRLNGEVTVYDASGWNYGNIRKVNYFIENYTKATGQQNDIDHFVGEAYFFRAKFYFELMQRFGEVPFIGKVLNLDSPELYDPRTARNDLADSIIEDLDLAISKMKDRSNAPSHRLTKEVAMLYKTRVALYEGTWEKYHEGTPYGVKDANPEKYFNQVVETGEALMNLGTCALLNTGNPESDYHNLFSHGTSYDGVSEVLMWKKYDVELGITHNIQRYLQSEGVNFNGISKRMIDTYLDIDGKPIDSRLDVPTSDMPNGGSKFVDYTSMTSILKNRDPRLSQTVAHEGVVLVEREENTIFKMPTLFGDNAEMASATGFNTMKGLDTDRYQGSDNSHNSGTTATICYRYAEALLNYAEAKAELGQLDATAMAKSVNLLRNRVGMPNMTISSSSWYLKDELGVTAAVGAVRRERTVELALEGFRFNDLMRWRAGRIIKGYIPKGTQYTGSDYDGKYMDDSENNIEDLNRVDSNGFIDPYHETISSNGGYQFDESKDYLMPVPQDQIVKNPNLTQNPGYPGL